MCSCLKAMSYLLPKANASEIQCKGFRGSGFRVRGVEESQDMRFCVKIPDLAKSVRSAARCRKVQA